jgi:hypothetical protein
MGNVGSHMVAFEWIVTLKRGLGCSRLGSSPVFQPRQVQANKGVLNVEPLRYVNGKKNRTCHTYLFWDFSGNHPTDC